MKTPDCKWKCFKQPFKVYVKTNVQKEFKFKED